MDLFVSCSRAFSIPLVSNAFLALIRIDVWPGFRHRYFPIKSLMVRYRPDLDSRFQSSTIPKARTGKVPIAFTFTGIAKKRKPLSGKLSKFVKCSAMGISAPSRIE